jgi:hypothetical protein
MLKDFAAYGLRARPMKGEAHFEARSDGCSRCRRQAACKHADVCMSTEPSVPQYSDGIIDLIDHL